jgi:phosphoribosylamine--glycine ligase/phosphoribosylformylglycinamidine cyclo-ligase
MRVMVVGSGGREHTLAWKLSHSPRVSQLFVAPGNGGTAALARNVPILATDVPALVSFARQERVDLTVVGPEAPAVAGLVDACDAAGLRAFGPTAAAARLEGSKAFAKRFMVEEGIPTAVGAVFEDYEAALAYLRQGGAPIVVKASGLAAGKGVTVCPTLEEAEAALHRTMVERAFGEAGDQVLIEACLEGEEASMLAFTDGRMVVPMLPARDYKRVGDGDQGPNTGGMGCYAPSPYLPPALVEEVVARVLQPTVDGMRRRGTPYVGVLYAGLMLTNHGPRVLEFNCRFGDPETQVLLPLLESDLAEIFMACLEGRLDEIEVRWKPAHTVCLVVASDGYPGSYKVGKEITGVGEVSRLSDVVVFQAGTRQEDGRLVTAGGRVLAVTATGPSLPQARERAYAAVERIHFDGAHYRRDIGAGAAPPQSPPQAGGKRRRHKGGSAYAAAGVDIEAKSRIFERMREAVQSTYTPAVLAGMGPFGGLFALGELFRTRDLVLVSSTDGVGTKTMIAEATGRYETIGHDIVNHCVNDVLAQGARPLFFLDYIASGKLESDTIVAIVTSCADACRASGCVLIGGETAEMPGVYCPGAFDLVGTVVGWVERDAIVDGSKVHPGDVCLGLPSSGLHTNGYSLARRVFADVGWETVLPELGRPVGEVLLTPHRAYLKEFETLVEAGVTIKAMSHITGGGFPDNLPRVLPQGVGVEIDRAAWDVPAIFRLIQERGRVDDMEMYHVFNMGIGMVLLVAAEEVERAVDALSGEAVVIGRAVPWDGSESRVRL